MQVSRNRFTAPFAGGKEKGGDSWGEKRERERIRLFLSLFRERVVVIVRCFKCKRVANLLALNLEVEGKEILRRSRVRRRPEVVGNTTEKERRSMKSSGVFGIGWEMWDVFLYMNMAAEACTEVPPWSRDLRPKSWRTNSQKSMNWWNAAIGN